MRKIKNLKFPEADEWIEKLGLNKNVSREVASFPVFVTAATSGYFDISQGVIKSVHEKLMPKYPNLKLIYYGLDLQDSQLSRVNRFIVSPAKQKRDICTAFPASLSSSSSSAA